MVEVGRHRRWPGRPAKTLLHATVTQKGFRCAPALPGLKSPFFQPASVKAICNKTQMPSQCRPRLMLGHRAITNKSRKEFMIAIEYCCLVEGSESLHVIRPQLDGANDNQYVFIFEGARDWSLITLIGDWEYEAVSHCLAAAANNLLDNEDRRTSSVAVGSLARWGRMKEEHFVGAEVSFAKIAPASGDMFGRFTIKLDEDAQTPFVLARKWRNINDRTFRIYRTDAELMRIARLLKRLEQASFDPVLESEQNDWFIPNWVRFGGTLDALALRRRLLTCRDHIAEVCPGGFSKFWLELLDGLELPDITRCPNCEKYFTRRVEDTWWKICLGCYHGNASTSHTKSEIDSAVAITPWLRQIAPTLDDEEEPDQDWQVSWR
jgi:hypothetical protein